MLHFFFYKLKVFGNPKSHLLIPVFPTALTHCFVSVPHFGNSANVSNFFIIMILVTVIGDPWSLMLLLQKVDNWLKAEVMVSILFLAIKYFFN